MMLVKELKRHLEGEVKIVSAYYDNIKPCIDCRYCWDHTGCSQNDEMQVVYNYLKDCDNVIIASPIYFSELSGQMLSLGSRLQTYYSASAFRKEKNNLKEKRGAIILCGGGDGSPQKAVSTASCLLHQMNAIVIGSVISLNTDKFRKGEDKTAIEEVYQIALKLNGTNQK